MSFEGFISAGKLLKARAKVESAKAWRGLRTGIHKQRTFAWILQAYRHPRAKTTDETFDHAAAWGKPERLVASSGQDADQRHRRP